MADVTAPPASRPVLAAAAERLSERVSIQSLAVFRILFGLLLVWDVLRFVQFDRIERYYVVPEFTFAYPFVGAVPRLGEPWIHWAWALVGVFAVMVTIGLFYRVAIVGFTLLFTYFFLLDSAQYLNHFYLVILFAVLLCFLPAHRAFSVDAWRRPEIRSDTVPYAAVFVLRAQVEIILIYAGLVKIWEDWLRGEPLGIWLRDQMDIVPFGALFAYDWVILAGAWGTIALHIVGAPLLLWERTRMATFVVYCLFHMSNAYFFNIGIFPWLTIGASLIFFAPDWPQRAARWLLGRFEPLPALPPRPVEPPVPLPAVLMGAMAVWLAVQVVVPLRHYAFPTDVHWTGDGHRFAWRMRMYDREARGTFSVRDPASGDVWVVEPTDYLTDRQAWNMMPRADMVWQFAGYLEEVWQANGYGDVEVYARIEKSLNGRAFQTFIDPSVDLTAVAYDLFGPDPWVLPLETPFAARR
jgi:hypothetical protein